MMRSDISPLAELGPPLGRMLPTALGGQRGRQSCFLVRIRFGHDAPSPGALWQVPVRRRDPAGRGAYFASDWPSG